MVSLWPWKGDDKSPASFEKALSTLSAKISKTSSKLDSLRQRSRRFSVLWTLYAGFAYLLYTIILGLVVGWRKWALAEYAAVVGGPVIIYLVRLGLSTYYGYRTSNIQGHLNELQSQRDATIEKLKAATRFNSTQELLKKYGGTATPNPKKTGGSDRKTAPKQGDRPIFAPPPTANIPGRHELSPLQASSQGPKPKSRGPSAPSSPTSGIPSPQVPTSPTDTTAEFAPNAFSATAQYAQVHESSRWYDRIMDVLLGEDETRAGARLALICSSCRLVNGQAPPGVKRLEDLGRWRCGGCGVMNGEETDAKKIVATLKKQTLPTARYNEKEREDDGVREVANRDDEDALTSASDVHESDVTQYSTEGSEGDGEKVGNAEPKKGSPKPVAELDTPRRRSTRATKGKRSG